MLIKLYIRLLYKFCFDLKKKKSTATVPYFKEKIRGLVEKKVKRNQLLILLYIMVEF